MSYLDARRLWHAAAVFAGLDVLLFLAIAASVRASAALDMALAVGIVAFLVLHVHLLAGGRQAGRVARALAVRGWRSFLSYRFQLVMVFVQLAVLIAVVLALGRPIIDAIFFPVGDAMSAYTRTNYVVFLLLGIAAWPMLWGSYEVSSMRIRQEQMSGMFETVIPTPAGVETLPFAYLVSSMVSSILGLAGTLLVFRILLPPGSLALGEPHALLAFAAVLALSVLTMWGLGLVIGGLVVLFKQAGPVSALLRFVLIAFAGIYVPIEVLPESAAFVARLLPLTYTFHAVRSILAHDAMLIDVLSDVVFLTVFAVASTVGGMYTFRRLLERARRMGTLYGY